LLWLKNNVDPWKSVEEKWADTADHRLNRIQCGKGEIADYFKDFPALKQSQGYTLVSIYRSLICFCIDLVVFVYKPTQ
jgi:hypothetical protein